MVVLHMAKDARLSVIDTELKKLSYVKVATTKDCEVYERGQFQFWVPTKETSDTVVSREYWKDLDPKIKLTTDVIRM